MSHKKRTLTGRKQSTPRIIPSDELPFFTTKGPVDIKFIPIDYSALECRVMSYLCKSTFESQVDNKDPCPLCALGHKPTLHKG